MLRPKLRIVTPSSRNIFPAVSNSLMYNVWELGKQGVEIDSPISYDEYPLSVARNTAFEEFLDSDCTHLFTYDDDQVFPAGTLTRLLASDMPLVSGWYLSRAANLGLVVFGRDSRKKLLNVNDFNYYTPLSIKELSARRNPPTPIFAKVDAVGMGAFLATKDAVKKLMDKSREINQPLFAEWSPTMAKDIHRFGEDLWFGEFCTATGLPIYVRLDCYVYHWAAQGFVIDDSFLRNRMAQEGLIEPSVNVK